MTISGKYDGFGDWDRAGLAGLYYSLPPYDQDAINKEYRKRGYGSDYSDPKRVFEVYTVMVDLGYILPVIHDHHRCWRAGIRRDHGHAGVGR